MQKPLKPRPVRQPQKPIANLTEAEAWAEVELAQKAIANARNKFEAREHQSRLKTLNAYLREINRRSFYFTFSLAAREFLPPEVFKHIEDFAKRVQSGLESLK
jgi:hypothetical protein